MTRLTPTVVRAIDEWAPSVGGPFGVADVVIRARARHVERPRGAPAPTVLLGRWLRRWLRRQQREGFVFLAVGGRR